MGVIPHASELEKRFNTYCNYGYSYDYNYDQCTYSPWYAYGRWILLAIIVIGAFLLFFTFSCITARRRRRQGMNPYPLTGWASRPPPGHGPAQYTGQQPYYNQGYNQGYQAPPAYGQQYGVANGPQQPNPAYTGARGGENVYAAPEGPPPSKKDDGIVR